MTVSNGNFIDEEGNVINIVQLLRDGEATPIVGDDGHYMRAHSGWYTDENGVPVNLITLLGNSGGSGVSGVSDVQVNGTSVVSNGVAEIPVASNSTFGAVKVHNYGVGISNGVLLVQQASGNDVKNANNVYGVITSTLCSASTFYGLARAAGDTTQKALPYAVGTYTEEAKSAIHDMLNGAVQVSGTTPTITALSGVRYVCGEVATLDITPCASGICDIVFTSGSTATVLTLPNTVKFPDGAFVPEANTIYEINIMDGTYGAVMAWT